MRVIPSAVKPGHPDYGILSRIESAILTQMGGADALHARFPELIRDALDFVLDPVRTGRTKLVELDNVEKTFIGLKIEHFIRDMLDVPKGLRRDLTIDGIDVDVKNTTGNNWMIPQETYSEEGVCLVIASDEATLQCCLGLLVARDAYLGAPNRDRKRSVKSAAFENILWLVETAAFPSGHWEGVNMEVFRELRKIKGGNKRAVAFFKQHLNVRVHRTVIQALLYNQLDYMKRVRANGGARDILKTEGIALVSGTYDRAIIEELKLPSLQRDEWLAIAPRNDAERQKLQLKGLIA